MGRKLSWIGGIITALYMAFMIYMVVGRLGELRSLELNALGDFLAGAFGPIAFLWLVLGFLQQGDELRQGTEALRLQAVELNKSVEQQSIMANAATEQIKAQQTALQLQLAERDREYEPDFVFSVGGLMTDSSGGVSTSLTIQNAGREIRDVDVIFEPAIGAEAGRAFEVLRTEGIKGFDFKFQRSKELIQGTLLVRYIRLDRSRWLEAFDYLIEPENPFIRIKRRPGGTPTPIG